MKRLGIGLAIFSLLLAGADFAYHKHATLPVEALPGFHGLLGLAAAVLAVLGARLFGALLFRREEGEDD